MIGQYVQSIGASLEVVLSVLTKLALPLSIVLGLCALAAGLSVLFQKENSWFNRTDWRQLGVRVFGAVAVGLIFVAGWSGLRAALPIARQDLSWREAAEATANPVPDAPAAFQYGPSVAAMKEKTYSRTLNMPPDFLQRVGEQGVGVLAPYLTDPSAENVLRVADNFHRSGKDVVFTRSLTRIDEEPIPFTSSAVRVRIRRLGSRAYDADFTGTYVFENKTTEAVDTRVMFPLPGAGTVRDLDVRVDQTVISDPVAQGGYAWLGKLQPGERKTALVHYRVLGARSWQYDLGSQRRRVQQFQLDVTPGGPVRFLRGSLQPTASSEKSLRWDMSNVVTAQKIALALPPETEGRESFLQALSALPASLVLFLAGIFGLSLRAGRGPVMWRVGAGLLVYVLGLGASVVLANYVGSVAAILVGPLAGAIASGRALGMRSLAVSVPAALVPAAFLSPLHSGLVILLLAMLSLVMFRFVAARSASDFA